MVVLFRVRQFISTLTHLLLFMPPATSHTGRRATLLLATLLLQSAGLVHSQQATHLHCCVAFLVMLIYSIMTCMYFCRCCCCCHMQGWCTVDTPRVRCSCDMDGVDGELCQLVTETVCPNQCSGHGECSRGFCSCFEGWYGLDCARLANASVLDGPTSAVNGDIGRDKNAMDGQDHDGASKSDSDKEGSDGDDEEGDGAGMSEKEAAEIAGDAALEAEAALHADSAAEEEADTAAAAEQIEAAAAAAAAALPDHLRLLFERPYLKNLIVDVWSAATSAVEAAAAATTTAAISTGADVPAAAVVAVGGSLSEQEQQQALINIAAHGGLAEAAAEVQAPPIPDIYFKPLHEAEEAATAQTEEAKKVKKRVARHLTTASEEDLQQLEDEDLQLERLEHQLEEAVKVASAAAGSVGGLHPGSRGQQKRQLLRHMWTGGGGRRGMISIAPTQETVTAAVQAWLSNTTSSTGSSTGSSSKEATLNAAMASAGVQMGRLTSEADRVLLQHLVEEGLGEVPEGKARRPRIFVYDMPSR
jgi:hypothetical protein